ncbi:MAG: UbiD family decarboxylase [Chloroflexi bacterium]|nr:UbiD family decarboxylase [Chloroflexota bacterium]
MPPKDLRDWLQQVEAMGELRSIEGAHWDLEIGALTGLAQRQTDGPALLFDDIPGYPRGYRVLTLPTRSPSRIALTLGLPTTYTINDIIQALREKVGEWMDRSKAFPPQQVESGPIFENVHQGTDVDLLKFPVPRWQEKDGGRYIGTGDVVVTRDPDSGAINLGVYRMMLHDRRSASLNIEPGKHGRLNLEKWHAKGQPCPVAVCLGQDPLLFRVAAMPVPLGVNEYCYTGAVRGEPVEVVNEPVTGLPVPADAEIVIAGWVHPGVEKLEGPFGEALGYYSTEAESEPVLEVEAVYHRNSPILLGSPMDRPPHENSFFAALMDSALLHNALVRAGVPDVKGVWSPEGMTRLILVVSIKQRYPGHARQAGLLLSQMCGGGGGRYVIVVDDDIDPTNVRDVLWALATRSDPEKGIEIVRRVLTTGLDPMMRRPVSREAYYKTQAVIEACKPFEWMHDFAEPISYSPELLERVQKRWPM